MRDRISAVFLIVAAGVLTALGGMRLKDVLSLSEPSEGVVERWDGNEVIILFRQQIDAESPAAKVHLSGTAERAYPRNEHTQDLKPGDKVRVLHKPGNLQENFFESEISYRVPAILTAAGALMLLVGLVSLLRPARKPAGQPPAA